MIITYLIPIFLLASCSTSNSNSKKYWDEKWRANSYDQNQANPFAVKAINYIKNNFKENSIKLLDLGSGNGREALYFADNGAKVSSEFNTIEIVESKDNYNGKNNAFIEAVASK